MVRRIIWTIESLNGRSDEDIRGIMANAIRLEDQHTASLCASVLATRNVQKFDDKPSRRRSGGGTSSIAAEVAEKMGQFARELSLRLDLSKETARRKAGGVKSFVYHEIVDSSGNAKLGGAEKTKVLQVDRYLSYRLGDDTITISAFLLPGEDKTQMHYEVHAPPSLFPEGIPLIETVRNTSYVPTGGTERYLFKEYPTLAEALQNYERILRKLQEMRGIQPLAAKPVDSST